MSVSSMKPVGFGWSEKGPFRSQNQDSFYFNNELGLYLVCDGMGGHADGKVAAELTIENVFSYCYSQRERIFSAFEKPHPERILKEIIGNAVRRSASNVYEMGDLHESCHGMGTTLTGLLISGETAVIAHVGDSRCYRIRDNSLEQLTSDHTLIQDLISQGVMSEEELQKTPFANALSKSIGQERDVSPDLLVEELRLGDVFLLSTDGLNGAFANKEEMLEIIRDCQPTNLARDLSYSAIVNGSKDNATALVVEISRLASHTPSSPLRAVA